MSRRTWTAHDPEPEDHPDVVDTLGEVWCWEDDSQGFTCACGDHVCSFPDQKGWWSPTLLQGHLGPWSSIFEFVHPNGAGKTTDVSELTPDESHLLCREMFS